MVMFTCLSCKPKCGFPSQVSRLSHTARDPPTFSPQRTLNTAKGGVGSTSPIQREHSLAVKTV
ncbi:hypothetical protein M427DRAFT_58318, partial [Gonapodya prolifera JEL478]